MEVERRTWRLFAGFAALAVLAGPARGFTAGALASAMELQTLAGGALSGVVAGVALLLLGSVCGQWKLRGRQWPLLLVLLAPQWLAIPLSAPYVRAVSWLHEVGWGVPLALTMAVPLWLALLAAMEWVRVEVPRAVVGAGIVGTGAAYLVIPGDSYSVRWNQAPVLMLLLVLSIAVVWTWAYAQPRLKAARPLALAGWFLLLSAAGDAALSLLYERSTWQPVDWHEVWAPLLMEAAVVACSCWLWFWLFQRMTLAAFSMRALAAWTAATIPGFAFGGFTQWRLDAAVAIAFGAVVVALRARVAEEQPMALGLNSQ